MKRLVVVALAVFGLCALPTVGLQAQAKGKSMTAHGTVKEVTGSSVVVTSGGKDMTFMVDASTKFVGKGLSTKTKEKGKLMATDAVGNGDTVSVTYMDMNGSMHASQVRITNKAMTAPKH